MKSTIALITFAALATAHAETGPKPEGYKEQLSYSIGYDIGSNIAQQPFELTPETVVQGVRDALEGREMQLSPEEVQATMQQFQQEMQQAGEKRKAEMDAAGAVNKKEGEAFLAKNAQRDEVTVTESGLQYEVVKPGEGKAPSAGDTVTVHYRGTLLDGTEFDSSHARGEPATFPVTGVIPGWTEALQLMQEGAQWKVYVPSDLAYAERGAGPDIGPHSTLIFEIELLQVNPKE